MPLHPQLHPALSTSFIIATSLALAACMGAGESASSPSHEAEVAPPALGKALATEARPATQAPPTAVGTAESEASAEPSEAAVAAVCRELMQRERDCSAVFIPALVAERVRLDIPAGIASEDARVGRDALVSQALDEYADDSKDERIAASCAGLARRLPADRGERLATAGRACLALDGCDPFVTCAVPISITP